MMKFSLSICICFLVFYNGSAAVINNENSQPTFGSFLGSCPEVKGIPHTLFEGSEKEWYTHRVLGNSPLTYVRCLTNKFDFKTEDKPSIKTQFLLPILPISFEITGDIRSSNPGEYTVNYAHEVLGNILGKLVVMQNLGNTAVVWNCLDFKFFHLESVEVWDTTSSDSLISGSLNRATQAGARRLGILPYPNPFSEIDQKSCK